MARTWSLFLIFFLLLSGLSAQEEADDPFGPSPPIDSDWDDYNTVYTSGDKTFHFTMGTVIPTIFIGAENNDIGLSVGGTITLAYQYYLTPNIFLGGELTGMFSFSRRGNALFIVPMGIRLGYQFILGRIEIPISLMVGVAPQKYLEKGFFGFILSPGASVFWRFNPDWSFGLNGVWWWAPQWPKNGPTVYGNFLELTLSVRYHF
jgi:hypothetical protein